jgi:hypothetical protein
VARPFALLLVAALPSCMSPYEARHEGQWDSRQQIWLSEASQVKLRAAQSRAIDSTDRTRVLAAVVETLQDLGFQIEVLDEELGIVSGRRFDDLESIGGAYDPTYHLYDSQGLLLFSRTYQTWGPFRHRDNVVRVTVTVRKRNEAQMVVRASAQFYLHAVEDPEPYQRFFTALQQSLLLETHLIEDSPG